jgi:hypothetical protein
MIAVALGAPARVGKLIVASADAHRPPAGRVRHWTTTACRRRPGEVLALITPFLDGR